MPLTDPNRSDEGFLLPIGGPKGSGLSLIFGLLAGTLNSAAFGPGVVDFNADYKSVTNTGQFIIAVDISAFMEVEAFKRNVDDMVRLIKASPTMPGFDEVLLPGENSRRKRETYAKNGIPMDQGLYDTLDKLAGEIGINMLG